MTAPRSPSGSSRSTAPSPTFPHAFGGALALAYYAEPAATIDIDLNVFVAVDRFDDVAAPLAGSVSPPMTRDRRRSSGATARRV